jgi:hypothetical protein
LQADIVQKALKHKVAVISQIFWRKKTLECIVAGLPGHCFA